MPQNPIYTIFLLSDAVAIAWEVGLTTDTSYRILKGRVESCKMEEIGLVSVVTLAAIVFSSECFV